ncbi:Brix-domain-containing protein [Microstroma glucosiphilum]|uniref:Brix-domain-containing protein n=1 Tax=Pseudomicrostroma glucosiphilum TaxID=1684307 RepID=A0A316U6U0_9BASI|nr:Brix-domain-containing protein [Pseudomicrostroma glucosiphilum]PWN20538.1 Brix-domain-containing protein [Pseudomicrostroma glucosiphilum]
MAKRRRKTRTHLKGPNNSAASSTTAPKSFVIRSGKVGRSVGGLVQDVRKVLEPNTAIRLRERKSNKLRDFVSMSGPLGVSHMVIFNQTDAGINMRVARCPRGPTCTFRVNKFALMNDVLRSQKRPRAPGGEFGTPPLLVLNNFGGEARHLKLLVTVFQNLFPPIQVQTMHLSQARRVVLLSYNAQTETIEWRHYIISVRPVGVSRSVRRVIEGTNRPGPSSTGAPMKRKGKGLPNLGNVGDISEYVLGRATRSGSVGAASDTDVSEAESELEDMNDPANAIELSERYVGRGNDANEQRAVRLREIGPRIELKLIKIEDGMVGGETLYHDRVKKTAKEATALKQAVAAKKKLKQERKAEQAANVARKEEEKAARKTKGKEQAAEGAEADEEDEDDDDLPADGGDSDADEDDDDFEYEDRFADSVPQDAQEERANLFDEDDDLGADDDDISLSEGDGEDGDEGDSFDEEDDDEEEEPFDYEDDGINHDDSDLDPIPVGRGLMAYDSDSDAAVGPAPALSKSNGAKSTLKKRKVDVGNARGKGKARR